jgi:hypothetical protein
MLDVEQSAKPVLGLLRRKVVELAQTTLLEEAELVLVLEAGLPVEGLNTM